MVYNPQIHHRKSIRLKGYDYTSEGAYFITICTHDRKHFFGKVSNGEMILNEIGRIAFDYLNAISNHFSHIEMGEFIVMPNHVHFILILAPPVVVGTSHVVVGTSHVMSVPNSESKLNQFGKPIPGSVSVIIQQYKSSVKRWCNKNKYEPEFGLSS